MHTSNKSCHCLSVLTCTYRIYTVHIRNLPAPHRWRPTKTCVQTKCSGVELVRRKTCIVWRIYCTLTRFLTVTFVPYRTYGEALWPAIQTCSIYTHGNFKESTHCFSALHRTCLSISPRAPATMSNWSLWWSTMKAIRRWRKKSWRRGRGSRRGRNQDGWQDE